MHGYFRRPEAKLLGEPPAKPEGAHWADPLTVITDVTYRADGAGYLTPGYSHAFVVSADGGSPRQLTFGAFNEDGPLSWTPDSRYVLLSGNRADNWRLDSVTSQVYRVSVADAVMTALTNRAGPFRQPKVSPDGSKIVFRTDTGGYLFSPAWSTDPGLYWIPAAGGNSKE